MSCRLAFVLDVESVGLHGEGFAYGWVVVDLGSGEEKAYGRGACKLQHASGSASGFDWLRDNLPRLAPTAADPAKLREAFWAEWSAWRERADLWADCGWPVEANFLSACVRQLGLAAAEWKGPYPLHDVATAVWTAGLSSHFPRLASELPEHDPLNDARHSARKLLEVYRRRSPA